MPTTQYERRMGVWSRISLASRHCESGAYSVKQPVLDTKITEFPRRAPDRYTLQQ